MNKYYYDLANIIKSHLWMAEKLDLEFLASFPEFRFEGEAYRALFSEDYPTVSDSKGKSFSKSIKGIARFYENSLDYDSSFVQGKNAYIYKSKIVGFDLEKAINYLVSRDPSLSDLEIFSGEEEVIAFTCDPLTLVGINLNQELEGMAAG